MNRPFYPLILSLLLAACGGESAKVCTTHLDVRLADAGLLTGADRALIQIETRGAPVLREVDLSGVGAGVPIEIPDTGDLPPGDSFRLTFAAYSGSDPIGAIGRSVHFGCLGEADQQVPLYIGPAGGFAPLTTSVQSRDLASGSVLSDGQVLIFGGSVAPAALLYDHSSGTLCASGNPGCNLSSPPAARIHHTATVLLDGRVLLVGGKNPQNDSVVTDVIYYDPGTGTFNFLTNLEQQRYHHAAVLLSGETNTKDEFIGKVLVAGGLDANDQPLDTVVLIDPTTGNVEDFSMSTPRYDASASMLGSGEVLVAGGRGANHELLDSVDLFDSSTNGTGQFGTTQVHLCPNTDATLCSKRAGHTATLIRDHVLLWGGQVQLATGATGTPPVSEVFSVLDVKGMPTQASATLTGSWTGHSATAIDCRKPPCPVLVAGDGDRSGLYFPNEKSGDQYLGSFVPFTQNPPADRVDHTAAALLDGTVLIFGGTVSGSTAAVFSLCETIGSLGCPGL